MTSQSLVDRVHRSNVPHNHGIPITVRVRLVQDGRKRWALLSGKIGIYYTVLFDGCNQGEYIIPTGGFSNVDS